MNAETLKGKWNQLKGGVKEKWGSLTDDDMDRIGGSRDRLIGAIQERYGKNREAAEKEVEAWQAGP
jgi:uncharacterized protein YjbJ (UPF0337 family)